MANVFNTSAYYLEGSTRINPLSNKLSVFVSIFGNNPSASSANLCGNFNTIPDTGFMFQSGGGGTADNLNFYVKSNHGITRSSGLTSTDIDDSAWHMLLGEFVGGASGSIKIFLDDLATPENSASGSYGNYDTSSDPFGINADYAGAHIGSFVIARMWIYDGILTADEKTAIKKGFTPRRDILLAYYDLDKSRAKLVDLSGNGHTLTRTGTPTEMMNPPLQMINPLDHASMPPGSPPVSNEKTYCLIIG